jgi:3-oxoacyl-(acyl-carrier-protein) synthase
VNDNGTDESTLDGKIAVIGMAGRFPGADSVAELWHNITHGIGGIRDVTQDELTAAGVPPAAQADPRYVRRAAPVRGADLFDAAFFGYSAAEAAVIDPQHRLFLECAWEALEDAGYPPGSTPGQVGLFGGVAVSQYGPRNVLGHPEVLATINGDQYGMGNTADGLCMAVAHKLGLTGPAVAVQSNCSTSLVAVHLAAQSLLTYDCDVALAGGVAVAEPLPTGYRADAITSPNGTVRSLDGDADGTVKGSGVGIVVLKRLADAVNDGDHVWAVLLGSAMNNDGGTRAGYAVPGVDGESAVMDYALAVADVPPDTVGYVECHAIGTRMGDSIELSALDRAYPGMPATPRVLSSIKPDIGHLDRAAGVASLIKATLALYHRVLPATRHFRAPNPALAAPGVRFTVLTEDRPWPAADFPRRAGVNSFGVGGTNVHVVLEEAERPPPAPATSGPSVLVLSARTRAALDAGVVRLREWLAGLPDDGPRLADVAHTLQASRTGFAHRVAVVCADIDDALAALADPDRSRVAGPVPPTGHQHTPTGARDAAEHWLAGDDVDWHALHDGPRRRVPLPPYAFQRERHFLAPPAEPERPAPAVRLTHPTWRRAPLFDPADPHGLRAAGPWWVVADGGLGDAVAARLHDRGVDVVLLRTKTDLDGDLTGPGPTAVDVDPSSRDDFARVLADHGRPRHVLHALHSATGAVSGDPASVLALVEAIACDSAAEPVDLLVCTVGAVEVTGDDLCAANGAALHGLPAVFDAGGVVCRTVDVDPSVPVENVIEELLVTATPHVALRGDDRWVRSPDPIRVAAPSDRRVLRPGAVVLVATGTGALGATVVAHCAAAGCQVLTVPADPLRLLPALTAARHPHGAFDVVIHAPDPEEPADRSRPGRNGAPSESLTVLRLLDEVLGSGGAPARLSIHADPVVAADVAGYATLTRVNGRNRWLAVESAASAADVADLLDQCLAVAGRLPHLTISAGPTS